MKIKKIGNWSLGKNCEPYIIAEIGVNHEGCMKTAKSLIKQAKDGGAHAAKFQSYKASKIASKNSPAYWDTNKEKTDSQFKLFQKYDGFGADEYKELASYCSDIGIDFMSTPFDLDAVDFLEPLMPAIKIASADITNVPLIRKCAGKGKPIILSTGAATLAEIEYALAVAKEAGANEIAILHCVLNYPTPEEKAQLATISQLIKIFPEYTIGYSDHVEPDATLSALEVATLFGSEILEKHFTNNKSLPGNDHYHSMDEQDLRMFVAKLDKYRRLTLGSGKSVENEQGARMHARRSIVASKSIKKGDLFSEKNLIAKRPGHGISPIHWDEVIGKVANCDIQEDELLNWSDISNG